MKIILCTVLILFPLATSATAAEPWEAALAKMPLATNVTELTKHNCVPLMLHSLQRNDVVKALVFMPGATDEFFFFNRGHARLDQSSPSLLDAVVALTNQTLIQVTYRAPLILLHTAEDPLEPLFRIEDAATAERIRRRQFPSPFLYFDRDWDHVQPILTFHLNTRFFPGLKTHASNHFFRHSVAGYDLNGWEALEALSLAGKTTFTVQKKKVRFEGDKRFRTRAPVPKGVSADGTDGGRTR